MAEIREVASVTTIAVYSRDRQRLADLAEARGLSRSALIRELLEDAYRASMASIGGKKEPGSKAIGAG